MAQNAQRAHRSGYGRSGRGEYERTGGRSAYGRVIDGNTARQLDVVTELQKPRSPKELNHTVKKNRDKAIYMNFGYVLFLTVSLLVAGFILIGYIRLQSEITASVKRISTMESTLNSLKTANDEEYSRIESSVDLDEIRRIAITELGMVYPDEDQIVTVPDGGNDYVRQVTDIDE